MKILCVCAVALAASSCSTGLQQNAVEDLSTSVVTTTSVEAVGTTTSLSEEVVAPAVAKPSTSQALSTTTNVTDPTDLGAGQSCQRLPESEDQPWVIVNDGVMGGKSQGAVTTEVNQMQFTGNIVTDGGGFSSVRRLLDDGLDESDRLQMRLRADERRYEILLTDIDSQAYRVTYYAPLETEGDGWQVIDVSFDDLEARIFGRRVDAPPFQPQNVTTIGIILADGADGEFSLELDWISACSDTL
ncbi:MAG: CIA30 family protein [Ilumatobacteraceae bacterium]|nr:CIA30 family protein [Ilumatobacteraceae bacterium]